MRLFWFPEHQGGLWLAPALLGVLLILIGVLIYAVPNLLEYVIAGIFVIVGCGLLVAAWRTRSRVTYQRVDRQWQVDDEEPPPL